MVSFTASSGGGGWVGGRGWFRLGGTYWGLGLRPWGQQMESNRHAFNEGQPFAACQQRSQSIDSLGLALVAHTRRRVARDVTGRRVSTYVAA